MMGIILQRLLAGIVVLSGFLVGKMLFLIAPEEISKKRKQLLKAQYVYVIYFALGVLLGLVSLNYLIYPAFAAFLVGLPISALDYKNSIKEYALIALFFILPYMASAFIFAL
ncbi:MAG: hypothetical protein ACMXX5_00440 [Candidatus Woesearchaeota archaeon]